MNPIDPEILRLARAHRGPYLGALSASGDKQPGLLALLALHGELARIPAMVSEPMLGRIRVQWWVDEVPGVVSGRPPSHPVAQALAPLGLDLETLISVVDAHNFAFEDGMASVTEHLDHAGASGGALATLMVDVLSVKGDAVRTSAHDIGTAWALAEVLASGQRVASLGDAEQLRTHAYEKIHQARISVQAMAKTQRKALSPVFVLMRLVERQLGDPHAPLGAGAVLSVWWASLSGRF